MFKVYRFNSLLLIFLFALAPLQGMETDSSDYTSTEESSEETNSTNSTYANESSEEINSNYHHVEIETYEPNDETFMELHMAIHSRNLNEVHRILKTYPAIIKMVDAESLNIPYLFFAENKNADTHNYALQITHLLLFSGMRMDSVNNNQPWDEDPNCLLSTLQDEIDRRNESLHNKVSCDEIRVIIAGHMHTRLYIAIENGNVDEVRRLVQKYTIDVNTALPYYPTFYYGALKSLKNLPDIMPTNINSLPLHRAAICNQNAIVHLLVDELGANVNIQATDGSTALHYEPDLAIAQFLVSKGANPNLCDSDGETSIDYINERLTPEMLEEMNTQPGRVEKFRALKAIFEGKPYIPTNNWEKVGAVIIADEDRKNAIGSPVPKFTCKDLADNLINNPINNNNPRSNGKPPVNDPDNVIMNSSLPWKLIGGGVAVVIVGVAAKKLYTWWHTKTEQQDDDKTVEQDEKQSAVDVQV